jgi:hypothetical protein
MILADYTIERLIESEAGIHYNELPPPGRMPFVVIKRDSPILLSAPHGAMTYRNNGTEIWHEEDEYTAGLVLLLSELCGTSAIATIWRSADYDPNEHADDVCAYKQEVRRLVELTHPRWFIDLHGAGEDSGRLSSDQRVDLGVGGNVKYLASAVYDSLIATMEKHLGKGVTDRKGKPGWNAENPNCMAAFAHMPLGLNAVQIEMKPSVRVPLRRVDSSMYGKSTSKYGGPYSAPRQNVLGMMQSLVEFIEYLKSYKGQS